MGMLHSMHEMHGWHDALHAARSPLYRRPICVLCIRYYYPLAPEELLLFRSEWLPAPPVLKRLLSFPSALTCASPLPSLKTGPVPVLSEASRALARKFPPSVWSAQVGRVGGGCSVRRLQCRADRVSATAHVRTVADWLDAFY